MNEEIELFKLKIRQRYGKLFHEIEDAAAEVKGSKDHDDLIFITLVLEALNPIMEGK